MCSENSDGFGVCKIIKISFEAQDVSQHDQISRLVSILAILDDVNTDSQ